MPRGWVQNPVLTAALIGRVPCFSWWTLFQTVFFSFQWTYGLSSWLSDSPIISPFPLPVREDGHAFCLSCLGEVHQALTVLVSRNKLKRTKWHAYRQPYCGQHLHRKWPPLHLKGSLDLNLNFGLIPTPKVPLWFNLCLQLSLPC